MSTWEVAEAPAANIRSGDSAELVRQFEDRGCVVRVHPAGYRSVHYLLKTQPTRVSHVVEVQVRTIFEEGWSEIDHQVRYPHSGGDAVLNQFVLIFNRLAGSADEMGSFIQFLKETLAERDARYRASLKAKRRRLPN
jgi:putative GTP pyrophosphokinase